VARLLDVDGSTSQKLATGNGHAASSDPSALTCIQVLREQEAIMEASSRALGPRAELARRVGSLSVDTIVAATGTSVARLISLGFLLLIMRVYSPADVGSWIIILTLAGCVQPFALLRYDIAVVIAPTRRIAAALAAAMTAQVVILTVIVQTSLLLLPPSALIALSGLSLVQLPLIQLVPIVFLFLTTQTIFQSWFTRERKFVAMAAVQILQAVVSGLAMLLFAWMFTASASAAAAGALAGLACGVFAAGAVSGRLFSYFCQRGLLARVWCSLKRYKVYPLYSLPYSLSAVFSERIFQVVLASSYSLGVLGTFFVARQIVTSPFALVQDALRKAMFAHSANEKSHELIKDRIMLVLSFLGLALSAVIGYGVVWLKPILMSIVGHRWPDLPDFAAWAMLPAAMSLYCGWIDRMLDVFGQQRLALLLQLTSDVVRLILVVAAVFLGISALGLVALISVVGCLWDFVWISVVLRVVGAARKDVAGLLCRFLFLVLLWSLLHYATFRIFSFQIAFGISSVIAAISGMWLLLRGLRIRS